jgi:branched-chain amino acid aminotransferase
MNSADWDNALTWFQGQWQSSLEPIASGADHALWMGSAVFDGARSFEGCIPDLDLHCQRLMRSASRLGMQPAVTWQQVYDLCIVGFEKFPADRPLYIRPMLFPTRGFFLNKPEECELAVTIHHVPMPPRAGFSATLTKWRRPHPDSAPTDAKAACLYPNSHRALREAMDKGFTNAIVLDHEGFIAEFSGSNLLVVIDGQLVSPKMKASFLNGQTRQRVIQLLAQEGVQVAEFELTASSLDRASEIISTGNMGKITRCKQYENRELLATQWFDKLHSLYWQWGLTQKPVRIGQTDGQPDNAKAFST